MNFPEVRGKKRKGSSQEFLFLLNIVCQDCRFEIQIIKEVASVISAMLSIPASCPGFMFGIPQALLHSGQWGFGEKF